MRNLKPSANRPPSLRRIPASAAIANVVPVQTGTHFPAPLDARVREHDSANVILSPSATLRINYAKNPKGFIPRQRSFASKGFGFFTSLRSVQNDSKSASADIPRGVTQRSPQAETHFPAPPGCPPPHQVRGKLREHDEDARVPRRGGSRTASTPCIRNAPRNPKPHTHLPHHSRTPAFAPMTNHD